MNLHHASAITVDTVAERILRGEKKLKREVRRFRWNRRKNF